MPFIRPFGFILPFRVDGASTPTNRVSNIVRSLKTLTTKEIGKSIFQRSYYDHIIRNQYDYNEIFKYIENNPKNWILKKYLFCEKE